MENLGAMAYSRYTGFREITDRDVLELHCRSSSRIKSSFVCEIPIQLLQIKSVDNLKQKEQNKYFG